MTTPETKRFALLATGAEQRKADFAADVLQGLSAKKKMLSCRYFYDEVGSQLFEEICALPEYYLTRAEHAILQQNASAIVAHMPAGASLVELGSGSASKTRLLIEAALARNGLVRYIPIDISRSILEESARDLLRDYELLQVLAVAGEYQEGLAVLQREIEGPKAILWLGSNVGNFRRQEAVQFLGQVRQQMAEDDCLIMGGDLRKEAAVLERAYDDAAGVTARFNKNLLARINSQLGGHFDLDAFVHEAVYDEDEGQVGMYLVSLEEQRVAIDALELEVLFAAGECIHTENSYKYSTVEIDALARASGLELKEQWFDAEKRFSLNLLVA